MSAPLDWLLGLERFGIVLDLGVVRHLLDLLGHPERRFSAVHVAGTNGKGSTCAFAEALLREAGRRVGLYTSPHLVRFEERIRIDGREIDEAEVVRLVTELRALLEANPVPASAGGRYPTFFEFTTAMAFAAFARAGIDTAVVEVGLGGRLDATNVLVPRVCVVTNVDYDHMGLLGDSLESIADEKFGIAKPRVPLVTAERRGSLLARVVARAAALEAPLHVLAEGSGDPHAEGGLAPASPWVARRTDGTMAYRGLRVALDGVKLGLLGAHQVDNAGLALLALEAMGDGTLPDEAGIRRALAATRWPGRLEQVREAPRVVLDGAHNPAAVARLVQSLREDFRYRRLILVASVMADKPVEAIVGALAPLAALVVATRAAIARAAAPPRIAEAALRAGTRAVMAPDLPRALDLALAEAGPEDLVLVAGSLFAVGEARAHLAPCHAPPAPGAAR
ncbi:MAG TPA: folylpolyglutamate synthase/dihydrofolate synthase family protein [Thermodesulfobacteriota bacterium]